MSRIARISSCAALAGALPSILTIVAADLCGAAEWQLQTTAEYARTRTQFEHTIGFFQAVKHPIVNMMIDVDRARSLTYAAACAIDAWRKADIGGETVIVDSLVRRRAAEKALFLRDMAHEAAPSVYMRAKLDYAASVLGAPVKYSPAPDVKAAPAPAPQVEPAQRLTEILNSEPATEALLPGSTLETMIPGSSSFRWK